MTSEAKRELSARLAAELRGYNDRLEISRNARTRPEIVRSMETTRYSFVAIEPRKK
jgi:hypothetical protein